MKRLIIILFVVFYQFTFSQVTNNFVEGEVLLKVSSPFSQIYLQNGIIQTDQEWFNDISNNILSYELKPVFENTEGDMDKFYVCRFPENYSVDDVIQTFNEEENVIHVWKNTIAEYFSNDPLFDQQWGLIKIQAPEAWNIESGNSNVILGVIDSGVDLGVPDDPPLDPHPDLEDNLWNINGMFGIDITNEIRPPYDEHGAGHGTKVSGIAGAE